MRFNTFASGVRRHSRPSPSPWLGIDATNLVAVLNRLEDAGLVERSRDRSDRRRAIIVLSKSGERLLADLDRALCDIDDEVFATLTNAERETLNFLIRPGVEDSPGYRAEANKTDEGRRPR